ncbi:MAG: hypothetical protein U1E65_18955 [Myxococcota bacterium]
MSVDLEEILKAALALPAEAREHLMNAIAESLDEEGVVLPPALEQELLAREAEAKAGHLMDLETFRRRVGR